MIRQFADITSDQNTIFQSYLEQFHELPRIFIKENIQDTENLLDHRFGIRHNIETDKFAIGDSNVDFEGPDMLIKGVRYKGTPGLYEVLFKNEPIGYTKHDEKEYLDILKRTNGLYNRNDPKLPLLRATKDVKSKYQRVIEPTFGRPRSSSVPTIQTRSKASRGYMTWKNFNKNNTEYKYFDDYNEIVERLRLLLAVSR